MAAPTTQTFAPRSGAAGQVVNRTNGKIIGSLGQWDRDSPATALPVPVFSSPADPTTGLVQPNKLLGLGDNKVTLTGFYNHNVTDATETGTTGMANGAYITVDLYDDDTALTGYQGVSGWVTNLRTGHNINNQVKPFSCVLEVDGAFPTGGAIAQDY